MSEKTDGTLAGIVARLESLERVARNRGSLTCDHLAGRIANIRGELQQIAQPQPPAEVQAQGGGDRRDREADRARFSDAAFNDWLDTGISDAGHTVWDMVGDLADAWAGWEARQFAGDAVLLTECCSREECGGECGNEWRGMAMYRKPSDDLAAPPSAATPLSREHGSVQEMFNPSAPMRYFTEEVGKDGNPTGYLLFGQSAPVGVHL